VQPYEPGTGFSPARPAVDARSLWFGGLATALVAALVAVVGVVVARGLFDVPVLAPKGEGTFGDASTVGLAAGAAAGAIVATALMHLLLLFTPRPFAFFGWIVTLVTAVAVLVPFGATAGLSAKVATAVINLLIGIAIGTLISGVAARSLRPPAQGVAGP
jgi:Family of unknown function (DUF6069)